MEHRGCTGGIFVLRVCNDLQAILLIMLNLWVGKLPKSVCHEGLAFSKEPLVDWTLKEGALLKHGTRRVLDNVQFGFFFP